MNSTSIAAASLGAPTLPEVNFGDGVVEIGLLLPANRAAALLELAEHRRESVAEVLRKLIERELKSGTR